MVIGILSSAKVALVAGLIIGCVIGSSAAATVELLQPFGAFALREPPDPPLPGGPYVYSDTGSQNDWYVSQWNIAGGKLSVFARSQTPSGIEFKSHAATASVKILIAGQETVVMLAQDGGVLPCTKDAGGPRESDLFLSPGKLRSRPRDSLAGQRLTQSVSLAKLISLDLKADARVQIGVAGPRQGRCAVNKGNALIGLIMQDRSVQPVQTLFYQLALNRYCADGCSAMPKTFSFFSKRNPFGVDDLLPLVGRRFLTTADIHPFDVELLGRLKEVVLASPTTMDRDLGHWVIDGVYLGQHIYGNVAIGSIWRDVRIVAVTGRR